MTSLSLAAAVTSHPTLSNTDRQDAPTPLFSGGSDSGTQSISIVALRSSGATQPICISPKLWISLLTSPTKNSSGRGKPAGAAAGAICAV